MGKKTDFEKRWLKAEKLFPCEKLKAGLCSESDMWLGCEFGTCLIDYATGALPFPKSK